MKCENCNSSWDSSVALEKCPFCGELLNKKELVVVDVSSALKKIISENTISIFDTPKVVISLVADYLEGFQREKKLLRIACSNGALKYVSEISKETDEEQQQILIKKLNTLLIDDAFLSEENAKLILNILLHAIGKQTNQVNMQNDAEYPTRSKRLTNRNNFSSAKQCDQEDSEEVSSEQYEINYYEIPMYKETIRKAFHGEGKVKSIDSGLGEYAVVRIRFEPSNLEKLTFENYDTNNDIPQGFIPSIVQGINNAMQKGGLAGFPVTGIKATLTGGSYHPVSSNAKAFEKAAQIAFEESYKNGAPIILEEIVEIRAVMLESSEQLEPILKKITALRGRVLGLNTFNDNPWTELKFELPLSRLSDIEFYIKSSFSSNTISDIKFLRYDELYGSDAELVINNKNKL